MVIKIKKLGVKEYLFVTGTNLLIIINFREHFAHKCKISKEYLHITVIKKIQIFLKKEIWKYF